MDEVNVSLWDDFEKELLRLTEQTDKLKVETGSYVSPIFFRGQSDASWHLETTLERYYSKKQRLTDYYFLISKAKARIETHTGKLWEGVPDHDEYFRLIENYDSMQGENPTPVKLYEYMIYLRHHGFPSPLLDWSESPYIAAYFAFKEVLRKADYVAIYAYIEYLGDAKGGLTEEPSIRTIGPDIRSDQRHFLQQCEYSICTGVEDKHPYYFSHEDVFTRNSSQINRQDFLCKFILPATERGRVIKMLDLHNINAYSLFGSEDSLMEAVFSREYFWSWINSGELKQNE